MYHCHVQIYLIGGQQGIFEVIKGVPPLERFAHAFVESTYVEPELLSQSDVVFAAVQGMDAAGMLTALKSGKKDGAELILLADAEQVPTLMDEPSEIKDIWILPMSESEVRFHFLRWQQTLKLSRDNWQANQFLDACINGSPDLIWFKGKDGVHAKVNDSFCKTVNKPKERVEGREYCDIWDVNQEDPVCILSEQEVMKKRTTCVTNEIVNTSGGEMPLTTYKSPLFDWDGSIMGTVSVGIDETLKRAYEKDIAEKSRALEIAQAANKAKSTFLSNVSHDIRTPMNAIMGFITLLKEEADNPERVVEYTQKISAANQHLLGLINDVLDMTKIESGNVVLNISELNLAELIDEINAIIRPQTKAKDQSFDIVTSSLTREHLLGDKLRINQILINLLSNAVKYTQNGGKITMCVRELDQMVPEYSRIQFTITDNGQGMSEEYQRVIFEPFTREQNSAWGAIQGTGLGMTITKSLVDMMNGSIKVASKLGEGSTFTVELELRIQEQEEDPGFWERYNVRRVLVADDDEDICRDIEKKMASTGVEIQYAVSGAQTIEMIRGAQTSGRCYDLILLDWKMPDLDGLATARLIRRKCSEKIPILLFTAYDWVDVEEEALEVGIRHFVPKPFFMSNFKDAIRRMMEEREKKAAPAKQTGSVMSGKRILVVDDIDVNRMILVKILSTLGATCDVAENGQKAVEKFEASKPGDYDIIFMDIQMPILNGYEATMAIRNSSHPAAQSVPIIAMTANAFVDDVRESLKSGMDAHIAKPIVLDHLERMVREVLDKKAQKI